MKKAKRTKLAASHGSGSFVHGSVDDPEVIRRFGMLKEITPLRCFFRGDASVKVGDIFAPNGLLNEHTPARRVAKGSPAIGDPIKWNRTWYRRRHVKRTASPNTKVCHGQSPLA